MPFLCFGKTYDGKNALRRHCSFPRASAEVGLAPGSDVLPSSLVAFGRSDETLSQWKRDGPRHPFEFVLNSDLGNGPSF